jgi:hypothetical protein
VLDDSAEGANEAAKLVVASSARVVVLSWCSSDGISPGGTTAAIGTPARLMCDSVQR